PTLLRITDGGPGSVEKPGLQSAVIGLIQRLRWAVHWHGVENARGSFRFTEKHARGIRGPAKQGAELLIEGRRQLPHSAVWALQQDDALGAGPTGWVGGLDKCQVTAV